MEEKTDIIIDGSVGILEVFQAFYLDFGVSEKLAVANHEISATSSDENIGSLGSSIQ